MKLTPAAVLLALALPASAVGPVRRGPVAAQELGKLRPKTAASHPAALSNAQISQSVAALSANAGAAETLRRLQRVDRALAEAGRLSAQDREPLAEAIRQARELSPSGPSPLARFLSWLLNR